MTTPPVRELARQGDPGAIAQLINQALQPKGITARVTRRDASLRVMLEAEQIPDQQTLVPYLQQNLTKLGIATIHRFELYGKQSCATAPAWNHSFDLNHLPTTTVQPTKALTTEDSATRLAPQTDRSPAIASVPGGLASAKNQKIYQAVLSGVVALVLILIGANLKSFQTMVTKSQTSKTVALSKPRDGVYQAPIINRIRGVPVIMVTFNGNYSFPMVVDTGAAGTLITQAMASTLGVAPQGQLIAQTANGYTTLDVGYVNSIEVDGARIDRVSVAIGLPDMDFGLLGHDFFGQFDVTVRENVVEFHPRTQTAE